MIKKLFKLLEKQTNYPPLNTANTYAEFHRLRQLGLSERSAYLVIAEVGYCGVNYGSQQEARNLALSVKAQLETASTETKFRSAVANAIGRER